MVTPASGATPEPHSATDSSDSISTVTLKGFTCLGVCPEYTLTLHKDGCIQLDGASNFALIGHFTAGIDDFEDVVASIKSHGFFSMAKTYPVGAIVLDARGTQLTVVRGEKSTTVTAWGDSGIPASFRELVNIIKGVALTAYWFNDGTGQAVSTVHSGGSLEMVHPEPFCGCQPCATSSPASS
jgi:hypothetical protein